MKPIIEFDILFFEQMFNVDMCNGKIYWKAPPKNKPKLIGKEAGSKSYSKGKYYWKINCNGNKVNRSKIIFYYKYGYVPENCIDHINGNSLDDRAFNIRPATVMQNNWNHKTRKKKSLLPIGVKLLQSGTYQSRISCNKKSILIGTFTTIEEASLAYQSKKLELFNEFAPV